MQPMMGQPLPPGVMLGGSGAPQGPTKAEMLRFAAIDLSMKFGSLFGYAPANGKVWSRDVTQLAKFLENGAELPANMQFNNRRSDGTAINRTSQGEIPDANPEDK